MPRITSKWGNPHALVVLFVNQSKKLPGLQVWWIVEHKVCEYVYNLLEEELEITTCTVYEKH